MVGSDEGGFLFDFFYNSKLCINRVYLKVHRVAFEAKMFFVSQFLLRVLYLGVAKTCILPYFQFVKLSFCKYEFRSTIRKCKKVPITVDRKRGFWAISDFVISCVPKLCVPRIFRILRFLRASRNLSVSIFRVTPSFQNIQIPKSRKFTIT